MKQALIYPHIIAVLLFVFLSFEARFQSNLPDYTVSANWNSGPQIVNLIGILNSSGIYPDMTVCVTATCCDELSDEVTSSCHEVNVTCNQSVSSCPGDFDNDGFVGVNDLLEVLGAYGEFCGE
tara:strand:+ start:716 stop:1084 length:369 start_codon:yes stop_codon:yes gene_type:complete